MDYNQLGKRVRQQRILNNLTQEQLAKRAGISCAFVGHIERGEKKASIETVVALCNALEVTPTVLLQDSLDEAVLVNQFNLQDREGELLSDILSVLREHSKKDAGYY